MWQTGLVILAVAAAGWYVIRRLSRAASRGQAGGCSCGCHEGPCPLQTKPDAPRTPECQDCAQCPLDGSGRDRPL